MAGNRNSGRPPKPASVKRREGNIGHKRIHPKRELSEPDLLPNCGPRSEELQELLLRRLANPYRETDVRHELWQKLSLATGGETVDLTRVQVLLQIAANAWADYERMHAQILDEGDLLTSPGGGRHKHPLISPCNQAMANLMKATEALGLTRDSCTILLDTGLRPIDWTSEIMHMDDIRGRTDWNPEFENLVRATEIRLRQDKEGLQ